MKRRATALTAVVCAAAMLMTGCQAKELSDEYVSVGKYKGVEVSGVEEPAAITDADVEAQISNILASYAEKVAVTNRAAEEGDIANIDYVGTKDGVAFDGGTAEGFDLTLGSGGFIDGFEAGIIGHHAGETFELNLTFPENYSEELAGQAVVFTVTLNSLSVEESPELTDDLVKETLSEEAQSVEEYKKEIKEELEKINEENYQAELRDAAWNVVLENTTVNEYPEEAIKEYTDMITTEYQTMATYYGLEFAEFLETYMGMDEETFNTEVEKVAQQQVKSDLVRDLLAENVKIGDSEKAYQEVYARYASYYSYTDVDAFLEEMESAGNKEALDKLVLLELVQNWIVDNCKIVAE